MAQPPKFGGQGQRLNIAMPEGHLLGRLPGAGTGPAQLIDHQQLTRFGLVSNKTGAGNAAASTATATAASASTASTAISILSASLSSIVIPSLSSGLSTAESYALSSVTSLSTADTTSDSSSISVALSTATSEVVSLSVGVSTAYAPLASPNFTGNITINDAAPAVGQVLTIGQPTAAPGTITVNAGGGAVAGVGTAFQSTFKVGDTITAATSAGLETQTISAIASNTALTTGNWTGNGTTIAYTTQNNVLWQMGQNGQLIWGGVAPSASVFSALNFGPASWALGGSTLRGYQFLPVVSTSAASAGNVQAILSQPVLNAGGGAFSGSVIAFSASASVGATNSQNWTGGHISGLGGLQANLSVTSGATGTITTVDAVYARIRNLAAGATITNAYLFYGNGIVATGTVSNGVGCGLYNINGGNKSYLILSSTQDEIPAGSFGIYENTASANVLKSPTTLTSCPTYSRQAPVTGFSITIGNLINRLILVPAGALATGTVTMPATPTDGQEVTVASSQTITALTVQANAGQTIDGGIAAATFAANAFATWKYVLADTVWYRIG